MAAKADASQADLLESSATSNDVRVMRACVRLQNLFLGGAARTTRPTLLLFKQF